MNLARALDVLSLPKNAKYTETEVKRHYRLHALRWHPDKCKCVSQYGEKYVTEKFIEGRQAYEFLMGENKSQEDGFFSSSPSPSPSPSADTLSEIYREYIREIWPRGEKYFQTSEHIELMPQILFLLQRVVPVFLKRETVCKLFEFVLLYHDLFGLEESMIQKMRSFVEINRVEEDDDDGTNKNGDGDGEEEEEDDTGEEDKEIFILHPTFANLLEDMVYVKGEMMVPLWRKQTIWKNQIYLCRPPVLPPHMSLDEEDNTLHVDVEWRVADIWGQTHRSELVGGVKEISIPLESLRLTEARQPIVLYKAGILREDSCVERANIVVWVRLRLE